MSEENSITPEAMDDAIKACVDENCAECASCPPGKVEDPTEQFDLTRTERAEALQRVEEVLVKAADGGKIVGKDIKKAIGGLYAFSRLTDEMTIMVLRDMYRIVTAVAQGEVNVFALRTHMKAIIRALDKKDLIKEVELAEIHDKEILYQELPDQMKQELQQAAAEQPKESETT